MDTTKIKDNIGSIRCYLSNMQSANRLAQYKNNIDNITSAVFKNDIENIQQILFEIEKEMK